MDSSAKSTFVSGTASGEFEATLRMIASLPAPAGLEDRVEAGLRTAPQTTPGRARILAWPVALRLENAWARSAAAAAIVAVVVGGGWGVYSRVQPAQSARTITVSPHGAAQGGFSSAGARRTPQTLNGPVVVPTKTSAPETGKPAGKARVRHGKRAAGKKGVAQPAAPAEK
jgi:hypothetical protein